MTTNELLDKLLTDLPQEDVELIENVGKSFFKKVVFGKRDLFDVAGNMLIFSVVGLVLYYIHQYGVPEDLDEIYAPDIEK